MKVVIFGGTGHIGAALLRHLNPARYDVTIVTRNPTKPNHIQWNGKTIGPWTQTLENADVVINLAGRRVHCRYNQANLQEMMDSRIDSTILIGQAIANAQNPPKLWLQSSTATIYAHNVNQPPNDEYTGTIGGGEPNVPKVWNFSIEIAKNWEQAFYKSETPNTRKVALRSAIMMGVDKDSAFEIFSKLTRLGLGGTLAGGKQYVSWIHEEDFVRALEHLIDHPELEGNVNVSSPNPVPQKQFAQALRKAWNIKIGLPAAPWMIAIGAWILNGDTELVIKSRRVIPTRLLESGFHFKYPTWPEAAKDLVARMKASPS